MDSWWLKVKRAQKHMVDIYQAGRGYARLDPYEFTRVRHDDREHKVEYLARITNQPDDMIAAMVGDFIHNLRTSLDHIVVASLPKKRQGSAGFPVEFRDIWTKDTHGQFVVDDPAARESFATRVEGLPEAALAIIERHQPYRFGAEADRSVIGIISRIENADKHRKLAEGELMGMTPKFVTDLLGEAGYTNLIHRRFLYQMNHLFVATRP